MRLATVHLEVCRPTGFLGNSQPLAGGSRIVRRPKPTPAYETLTARVSHVPLSEAWQANRSGLRRAFLADCGGVLGLCNTIGEADTGLDRYLDLAQFEANAVEEPFALDADFLGLHMHEVN